MRYSRRSWLRVRDMNKFEYLSVRSINFNPQSKNYLKQAGRL